MSIYYVLLCIIVYSAMGLLLTIAAKSKLAFIHILVLIPTCFIFSEVYL
jgi:hypothetical protein